MRPLFCLAVFFANVAAFSLFSAQPVPLLAPYPDVGRILHEEQTPPPQSLPDGLFLPVLFTGTTDRVYWDIPLSARIPAGTTALEIDLSCSEQAPIRGLSVHLLSGDGWYASSLALNSAKRQRLTVPRGLFQTEGTPGAWEKSRTLRLSAWKKTSGVTSLTLHAILARADTVAVIRATECTAPGETAFAAMLVDRCVRLLTKADIPFAVIDDSLDALSPFTLLLLPYAPTLPDKQLSRLERFLKHNGKLIVFYNASQPLGRLLGVRPGVWQGTEPGLEWSALLCDATLLPGVSARIPHFTNSILPPFATQAYHARQIAAWADETSRPTDQPACVLTDRGAWFAHVPPLAYPSAVSLLRTLAHTLAPSAAALQPLSLTPQISQPLPATAPDEIRAAWNTSATARHPRGWDGLMEKLSKLGINTLFVHWQSAGTALYKTRSPGRTDTLADALAAGKKQGVSVHAWVTCWTLDGADADQTAQLTREGRLMRDSAGNTLPWLCPSLPENRALIIEGLRDLARRGVQGIHLDYVRYPDSQGCYAAATRRAFETELGKPVTTWPADVMPGGGLATAFQHFKRATITAFVREAHDAVRAINPSIRLSAAVYTPDSAAERGQAWPDWVRDGLVDFVCPMIYTENENDFASALDTCILAVPQPQKTLVPGIGTGTDMSQLDATATSQQVRQVRARHLAGFGFFALDDELMTAILPSLQLSSDM